MHQELCVTLVLMERNLIIIPKYPGDLGIFEYTLDELASAQLRAVKYDGN